MLTTNDGLQINVKDSLLSNEKSVKLQGMTVDKKLSYQLYLNVICKKSWSKN